MEHRCARGASLSRSAGAGIIRKLGVPGEELDKVYNRLFDPKEFTGKNVLVVGGGDSALETAIALTTSGANVTLSYRGKEFSRAEAGERRQNRSAGARLRCGCAARASDIRARDRRDDARARPGERRVPKVALGDGGHADRAVAGLPEERNAKRRSLTTSSSRCSAAKRRSISSAAAALTVAGDWRLPRALSLAAIILVCIVIYHWKKGGVYFGVAELFERNRWFPFGIPDWWASLGPAFANRANLLGTLRVTLGEPGFYYSLAYTALRGAVRRAPDQTPQHAVHPQADARADGVPGDPALRRCRTSLLPWMGNNGWFDAGSARVSRTRFFPPRTTATAANTGARSASCSRGRCSIWNVFTEQPMWAWLAISFVQTFVLIPLIICRWGKGAYCGWICSCGALAETLGDAHRTKMPHGPRLEPLQHARPGLPRDGVLPPHHAQPGVGIARLDLRRRVRVTSSGRCRSSTTSGSSICSGPASSASASTGISAGASGAASPVRSPRSCTSTRASRVTAFSRRRRNASRATSARRSVIRAST